jgi:hypothetical protein
MVLPTEGFDYLVKSKNTLPTHCCLLGDFPLYWSPGHQTAWKLSSPFRSLLKKRTKERSFLKGLNLRKADELPHQRREIGSARRARVLSAGLAAQVAPRVSSGPNFAGVWPQSVTAWPQASSRVAIVVPMMPDPDHRDRQRRFRGWK